MDKFVEIDHPADLALRVYADTIAGLFMTALEGMYFLIFNKKISLSDDCDEKSWHISFTGKNYEDLLMDWLSELHYKLEVENLMVVSCNSLNINEVSGEIVVNVHICLNHLDELKLVPEQEIKAITYHQMAIKKEAGRFSTIIVFDV